MAMRSSKKFQRVNCEQRLRGCVTTNYTNASGHLKRFQLSISRPLLSLTNASFSDENKRTPQSICPSLQNIAPRPNGSKNRVGVKIPFQIRQSRIKKKKKIDKNTREYSQNMFVYTTILLTVAQKKMAQVFSTNLQ